MYGQHPTDVEYKEQQNRAKLRNSAVFESGPSFRLLLCVGIGMKINATTAIGENARLGYAVVMFVIITFGLLCNIAMIIVLKQVEHRAKTVSHLIMNLALADIIICALGYPVVVQFSLTGSHKRHYRSCLYLNIYCHERYVVPGHPKSHSN